MQGYSLLAMIAAIVLAACVWCFWPWLRQRNSRDIAMLCVAVGVFLTLALYLAIGNPFLQPYIEAHRNNNQQLTEHAIRIEQELSALRSDISADDLALKWAELGAVHMQLEQYTEAADALKQAVLASEGNADLIMAYGKALMLSADGHVTEEAKQAFTIVTELRPEYPEPFFLLAVERMQAGDRKGARALFAELLPKLPEGAPLRERIMRQIEEDAAANTTPDMTQPPSSPPDTP